MNNNTTTDGEQKSLLVPQFSTTLKRADRGDWASSFRISATLDTKNSDLAPGQREEDWQGIEIGFLEGMAITPGYLPGAEGHDPAHQFIVGYGERRLEDVYEVVIEHRRRIGQLLDLNTPTLSDYLRGFMVTERYWVHPDCRGNRLFPRMLEELLFAFSAGPNLLISKVDSLDNEPDDDQLRSFAAYCEDADGVRVLDPEQLPGWFLGVRFADDVNLTEEEDIELLVPPVPNLDLPPPVRREEDDDGEGED